MTKKIQADRERIDAKAQADAPSKIVAVSNPPALETSSRTPRAAVKSKQGQAGASPRKPRVSPEEAPRDRHDFEAELKTERKRRQALEAMRCEYLRQIALLVEERADLENELQANAARHRKQLAAFAKSDSQNEASKAPPSTAVATIGSPGGSAEGLPQFTRPGRLDLSKARRMQAAARDAFKAGRWAEAVALYRDYLSYHPRRAAHWKQFAHALKENGQPDLAERAYFRALALEPSDIDTALHLGHLLKNQNKLDLAAEVFLGGLKIRPDHVELRHSLGNLGRPLPDLTPATSAPLPPTGFKAWLFRREIAEAQKMMKARRWADAAGRYRKLADHHKDGRLVVQYGHALKETGDLAGAEQAYRRALNLMPLSSDAWLQLGHVLKLQDDFVGASSAYHTAVRLGPDNADALKEI